MTTNKNNSINDDNNSDNKQYLPKDGFPKYPNMAKDDKCENELNARLFKAVEDKDVQLVASLLEEGASPETFHPAWSCVLHLATISESPYGLAMTKLLLDAGADPNLLNPLYRTPLDLAVSFVADVEVIRLLIERGAEVDGMYEGGTRALHAAAARTTCSSWGKTIDQQELTIRMGQAIFDVLIEKGSDVNMLNEDYESPLHYAARVGSLYGVQRLLESGADPKIKNLKGETAFDLCSHRLADHKNNACLKVLEEATP